MTTQSEKYYSKKDRDALPDSDFAGPHDSFPIRTQDDVHNAARLIGHAENPDAVKAKIIAIAKRKGFSLPDAWQTTPKESASPALASGRVATLTTCWLEDDAISLNGRKYPREAVDRLIQSAQLQLSTPGAKPLTCYISHDAADQDDSLKLVGKLTNVWREGARAMANIDIANTHAGRDAATLAVDGYLVTQSLRASNAELHREKDSTWPVVGGKNLTLEGIDFTATPGIQIARIQNVALAESVSEEPQNINEVFNSYAASMLLEQQGENVGKKTTLDEAADGNMSNNPGTSGNTASVTADPTQDAYGQTHYHDPKMTSGAMQGMDNTTELQEAHDHVAIVQGRSCAPGKESTRYKSALKEAGRTLSGGNDAHLDVVHHTLAKHLNMECAGANNKESAKDPDNDGDDDRTNDPQKNPDFGLDQMEKAPKGNNQMTEAEALKLLSERGYQVQTPKSEAELLREQLAAQKQRLDEMEARFSQQQPAPQRKSLVSGATTTTKGPANRPYMPGSYLKEKISNLDWNLLADRTAPLPEGIDPELLLKEFEQLYAVQYDDRYGNLR